MRERLLAAFLSLTLLTVLLYGVPRAYVRADVVNQEAQREVSRSAQVVAVLVEARSGDGQVARVVAPTDSVVLRRGSDVRLLSGPALSTLGEDATLGTAQLSGGGAVEVRRPQAVVRQDVVRALRPIVLIGLVALAVAALAGVLLAGRLARPFSRLAEHAAALGAGEFTRELPTQRVQEAERIAAALRDSGRRLQDLITREREFARNASHQLRTPLTGMRLRIEDVSLWPETAPVVREELEQVLEEVDRLSDTVTELLAFARRSRSGSWESVEPAVLIDRTLDRWRPLAAELDRSVRAGEVVAGAVSLPRNAVEQVLDVLVDNALKHGRGGVTVGVQADAGSVRFCVSDEGSVPPGRSEAGLLARSGSSAAGEGIGLALCDDLARSLGGRLRLLETAPTTFELLLPVEV